MAAQSLKRLVAGFPPRLPGFAPGSSQVAFVVDKVELGHVSPVNIYCTKFSILTITRGRYNRPEVTDVLNGPIMDFTTHYQN
jgi:hypothetical protein